MHPILGDYSGRNEVQRKNGEWLRNIGAEGVGALRLLMRDFTAWALQRAKPEAVRLAGLLESFFDDLPPEHQPKRVRTLKECPFPRSLPACLATKL